VVEDVIGTAVSVHAATTAVSVNSAEERDLRIDNLLPNRDAPASAGGSETVPIERADRTMFGTIPCSNVARAAGSAPRCVLIGDSYARVASAICRFTYRATFPRAARRPAHLDHPLDVRERIVRYLTAFEKDRTRITDHLDFAWRPELSGRPYLRKHSARHRRPRLDRGAECGDPPTW
jgi:hypothetical protein